MIERFRLIVDGGSGLVCETTEWMNLRIDLSDL